MDVLAWTKKELIVASGIIFLVLMTNAFHEAGHAIVAWWCGDRRPEIRRRMTLNPLVHAHWFLTFVLPLVSYLFVGWPLGGALPVMVDQDAVGPRKMGLVGIAGSIGNLIFAVVIVVAGAGAIALGWIDDVDRVRSNAYRILTLGMWYSAFIIVINLIPIPPADGSRVLGALMPERMRRLYYATAPVGIFVVFFIALWATGALYEHFPSLGRGYAREMAKAQSWMFDQMDALATFFGA
jgi:Zn-dependent protease